MRFIQELPSQFQDKNSSKSAKTQFMKSVAGKGKKPTEKTAEERYQDILKEKMEEVRSKAMNGAKYTFQLPGTDASECRELSAGAQEVLQKIAEKKAKKEEKKAKKEDVIKVSAKYFTGVQGGRIDAKGRIFDSKGQCILVVDKKTGSIKNARTGNIVGKYKAGCGYSEHRICELIGKYDTSRRAGWHAGAAGHAGASTGWGTLPESSSQGSIWGTTTSSNDSGGSIWSTHSSDDNKSWW